MNRHHFSLFVRNCRLILLLRREFGDGDLKSFRPAEFRWKLPQVLYYTIGYISSVIAKRKKKKTLYYNSATIKSILILLKAFECSERRGHTFLLAIF